jgi:AAHS family benzoate transporter-like MFS transporter
MNFGILLLIIPSYMTDFLSLNDFQTGIMTAIYPISIVIGAIIGGVLTDKYGRKLIILICFTASLVFSALLIFADTWQILAIIYAIIGLLQGSALYAALAALAMDITNPKIGATQYSILTSVHNFGDIGISMISGSLVLILGYDRFFLYAALLVGPALLILYFVKDKKR